MDNLQQHIQAPQTVLYYGLTNMHHCVPKVATYLSTWKGWKPELSRLSKDLNYATSTWLCVGEHTQRHWSDSLLNPVSLHISIKSIALCVLSNDENCWVLVMCVSTATFNIANKKASKAVYTSDLSTTTDNYTDVNERLIAWKRSTRRPIIFSPERSEIQTKLWKCDTATEKNTSQLPSALICLPPVPFALAPNAILVMQTDETSAAFESNSSVHVNLTLSTYSESRKTNENREAFALRSPATRAQSETRGTPQYESPMLRRSQSCTTNENHEALRSPATRAQSETQYESLTLRLSQSRVTNENREALRSPATRAQNKTRLTPQSESPMVSSSQSRVTLMNHVFTATSQTTPMLTVMHQKSRPTSHPSRPGSSQSRISTENQVFTNRSHPCSSNAWIGQEQQFF